MNEVDVQPPVITVAAAKGGVGKTTLAVQLAACLGGVLVDLDHEAGGATGQLMPQPPRRGTVLDGLEAHGAPTPRALTHRPDLVPASPDLASSLIDDELVRVSLRAWAQEWGRAVVVDTAPGHSAAAVGAVSAADLVIAPVALEVASIRALGSFVREWEGYPLMIVPVMAPARPARSMIALLSEVAGDRYVAAPISEHRFLRRRLRRTSICLVPDPGRDVARAAEEFRRLSREVETWLTQAVA